MKDGPRMLERVLRRQTFRERSGRVLGSECEGSGVAGLMPWRADIWNGRQRGNEWPIGAGGARTGPGILGIIR
jgi:hypothetical protein